MVGRTHKTIPMPASPPPIQMPARAAATMRESRSSRFGSVSELLWRPGPSGNSLTLSRAIRPAGPKARALLLQHAPSSPPNGLKATKSLVLYGKPPGGSRWTLPMIVAQAGRPGTLHYPPARRPKVPGVLPGGQAKAPPEAPRTWRGAIGGAQVARRSWRGRSPRSYAGG
jgi:hypothetical protein